MARPRATTRSSAAPAPAPRSGRTGTATCKGRRWTRAGELWTAEHGARGGDELNNPRAGRNYGWPIITYGVDYSGARIGVGTSRPGMEQPVYYWDPVIAPSGALFYTGDRFPAWRGDFSSAHCSPAASSVCASSTATSPPRNATR